MPAKSRRASIAAGAVGLLLVLGAIVWLLPGGLELQLTMVKSGAVLLALPMEVGERFTIHYYHSVENAPIWEVHSLDAAGRIYIEEERYLKFGAGMGRMPGVGHMVMRGPYEAIEDMHMPTGDFVLRVGSPGVDHTLIWRHRQINLSARIPHQAVQFSARRIGLGHRWMLLFRDRATMEPNTVENVHE